MPIIRRKRPYIIAYGVLHCNEDSMAHKLRVFPPPVTVQNTICSNTMSCSSDNGQNDAETCRDRSLIINIGLVASCWFISLHFVIDCHRTYLY